MPNINSGGDDLDEVTRKLNESQRLQTLPPDSSDIEEGRAFAEQVMDPLVGKKLDGGRYHILSVLGRGGMSVVYKARQELVDRPVAIKTLTVQLLGDPLVLKRFQREIQALSKLSHPNIVSAFDCVMDPSGQPYFIMDYLDGESLAEILYDEDKLTQERVQRIFIQVCSAVAHAHSLQVLHRDLKPANIMILNIGTKDELAKVVDFGLAKLSEDCQKLTVTGEVWGSPSYMSPEQVHGKSNDFRSDIYSLGCVMFEALAGRPPYVGSTPIDTVMMQVNAPVPTFASVDPELNIHPGFEAIILTALQKKADERFQSMAELLTALQELDLKRPANFHPTVPLRGNRNESASAAVARPVQSGSVPAPNSVRTPTAVEDAFASTASKPAPNMQGEAANPQRQVNAYSDPSDTRAVPQSLSNLSAAARTGVPAGQGGLKNAMLGKPAQGLPPGLLPSYDRSSGAAQPQQSTQGYGATTSGGAQPQQGMQGFNGTTAGGAPPQQNMNGYNTPGGQPQQSAQGYIDNPLRNDRGMPRGSATPSGSDSRGIATGGSTAPQNARSSNMRTSQQQQPIRLQIVLLISVLILLAMVIGLFIFVITVYINPPQKLEPTNAPSQAVQQNQAAPRLPATSVPPPQEGISSQTRIVPLPDSANPPHITTGDSSTTSGADNTGSITLPTNHPSVTIGDTHKNPDSNHQVSESVRTQHQVKHENTHKPVTSAKRPEERKHAKHTSKPAADQGDTGGSYVPPPVDPAQRWYNIEKSWSH